MGMFDNLRCLYPLPVKGANERQYQTKDTPCQYLNDYEITKDGVLRHREFDPEQGIVDGWIGNPDFIGEIRFYNYDKDGKWIEFSSYFVNGLLKELHLVSNEQDGN